jgi:hypothetical protein
MYSGRFWGLGKTLTRSLVSCACAKETDNPKIANIVEGNNATARFIPPFLWQHSEPLTLAAI